MEGAPSNLCFFLTKNSHYLVTIAVQFTPRDVQSVWKLVGTFDVPSYERSRFVLQLGLGVEDMAKRCHEDQILFRLAPASPAYIFQRRPPVLLAYIFERLISLSLLVSGQEITSHMYASSHLLVLQGLGYEGRVRLISEAFIEENFSVEVGFVREETPVRGYLIFI